ncbi:VirD4-like conjugal transfer protein, CD1115 family [Cytobacillus oceanisediminis]|uniref:VirD4-like conjugal transfer protein, CD1115 family n=1 Tax=Cytobacillus oceanisediminis TaxID=665099 RepID=UPI002815A865|nr:type IV secretory system conjugative DNA transfer family protein [Cytobacillus oceanisediminis]
MKSNGKRMAKNIFGLLIAGSVFSYFVSAAMRTLNQLTSFQTSMMDYEGTYQFVKTTDSQTLLVIIVGVLVLTGFVGSKMEFKSKSYQDASAFGIHGTSRWGTIGELIKSQAIAKKNKIGKMNMFKRFTLRSIEKSLSVEEGIVVGKVPNKNELVIIPKDTSIDNRNVLVIGASGSGKGQSYVFPNLINNHTDTMIVTDPKGEIYNATHQLKRDQGYEVFQIDFLNLNQAKYNPLDYVFDDLDASKVSQTIARNSAKDGKEDFFFNTAKDLLTGLIIYCKEKNPNANIPFDVKGEFYKLSEDEEYLRSICREIGLHHPAYSFLKDASVADGKTRTSILSSFAQQTAIFSLQKVAKMTTGSDFNFFDFQKKKSILYVKIPMKNNPVEALTATFFDQLITVLYDIADKNHGVLPIPTFMLLDEFANLGKINDYDNTLSTCRGLGIGITTIIQDFGQLEGKYGKEVSRTIRSNHDTHLFLATKDPETAKYYSQLAGETTARMTTKSNSTPSGIFSKGSSSTSQQEQYVKKPLIPEGELTIKDKIDCYLFITNQYPIKLEKSYQFNIYGDFLFKNRKPNYHNYRDSYMKFLGIEETKYEDEPETLYQEEIGHNLETHMEVFPNTEQGGKESEINVNKPNPELASVGAFPPMIKKGNQKAENQNDDFRPFIDQMLAKNQAAVSMDHSDEQTQTEEIQEVIEQFISGEIEIKGETIDKVLNEYSESVPEEEVLNNLLFDQESEENSIESLAEVINSSEFNKSDLVDMEKSFQNIKDAEISLEIFNEDPEAFFEFDDDISIEGNEETDVLFEFDDDASIEGFEDDFTTMTEDR